MSVLYTERYLISIIFVVILFYLLQIFYYKGVLYVIKGKRPLSKKELGLIANTLGQLDKVQVNNLLKGERVSIITFDGTIADIKLTPPKKEQNF